MSKAPFPLTGGSYTWDGKAMRPEGAKPPPAEPKKAGKTPPAVPAKTED